MIYYEVLNKDNFPIASLLDYGKAVSYAVSNKGKKIVKTENEYGEFNRSQTVWTAA